MNAVSRRDALKLLGGGAAGLFAPATLGGEAGGGPALLVREIPSTGERLPAVGLGTWETFDVGPGPELRRPLAEVLGRFAARGGRLVDSSPMYGRAEGVVGVLAAGAKLLPSLFVATKVWTRGKSSGLEQMERSRRLLGKVDLLQVHNLLDLDTQLASIRAWKAAGRVRYVGVTHYTASAHAELARVLKKEKPDFLQVNYSIAEPDAEASLLPLAADLGVAVIANRPFGGGEALRRALREPLPAWAAEAGCTSWAQVFLKWILGNPAVTCTIPATSKVAHLEDNLGAAALPLPDAEWRRRARAAVAAP
jgi:diketogulonate reductase-like aldo/keto reductase